MSTNGKEKRWRVALLRMKNVMGVASAEIKPGALTLIEGKNEAGKTSMFEAAIAGLTGGGNPTRLLRQGADEGEILYHLDDFSGPPYLQVKTSITKDGVSKDVRVVGQPKMSKEATVLDGIRNKASMLPVGLLTGKKEERVQALLKSMPLTISREDLAAVLPLCDKPKEIDLDRHAFQVLDEIDKNLRTKRTGVNAVAEQNRKTCTTLKAALPEGSTEGNNGEQRLSIVAGEMEDWRKSCEAENESLRTRLQDIKAQANADYQAAVSAAAKSRDERTQAASDAYDQAAREREAIRAVRQQELSTELAKAETFVTAYRNAEASRKMIADLSEAADAKELESKTLTEAIRDDIPQLRAGLLEQVPIKGVSVVDGDIAVDNKDGKPMPWESCNTATRVGVTVDLALLTAGPLKWLCMDGGECLDADHIEALRAILEERGAQAFVTRVTSGPLSVRTA